MGSPQVILNNFIGGRWVATGSQVTMPDLNPADTRDVLCHAQQSTADDARAAVDAARKAARDWRARPAPARGALIAKAAAVLTRRKDEITALMAREEGKCPSEAAGEVQRAINAMEFLAGEGRRPWGEVLPSELPSNFLYSIREPLGVVALITPFNFPIAIPAWKLAAALVTGNTVVLKPAALTPWCSVALIECLVEAGLPDGVVNLLTGGGPEVGEALVDHPDVKAISFTGSNTVGDRIAERAGRRRAKVQLEMGGKNAVIVLADADLDLAASAVSLGAFGSTGQRCTATSRVVVERSVAGALIERLLDRAHAVQVGPVGASPVTYMGPSVDERQMSRVLGYLEVARQEGAKAITGGERLTGGALAHGYFVAPTILTGVKRTMRVSREEIFGPVLSVLEAGDFDEAIDIANDSEFGLAGSIFTRDVGRAFRYLDRLEAGMLHINSATVGGEVQVPFGGLKNTGFGGREMGTTAVDFFTEWKSVYVDYTGESRKSNVY